MARRISSRPLGLGLALGLGLCALAAPRAAHAQDARCDSADHRRARAMRDQGRDQEAYDLFAQIYARDHSTCARVRMGLALRALGRWSEAEAAIVDALTHTDDPWMTQARGQAERELSEIRPHVGDVAVDTTPAVAGAEVWLRGARVGTLPLARPLRVNAGTAVLEVRAPGYRTAQQSVDVAGGGQAHASIALTPERPGQATRDPSAQAPTVSVRAGGESRGRGGASGLGVAGIATGGALAVAGVVLWVVAEGQYNHYVNDPACRSDTVGPETLCPGDRANATLFRQLGITGLGVGVALAATGVVLLVAGSGRAEPARSGERASVRCAPQLDGVGVSCVGTF